MKVIRITPRGYCYGVVDAMVLAKQAADDKSLPRPLYILGMIVHNRHVVEAFQRAGVITLDGANRLDLLEQITQGTVIFTAHGVSPEVKRRAVKEGYDIIYIGRKGHPEPEGACGVAPEHVFLVEKVEDIEDLNLENEKIAVTNQTTMSQWDTTELMERVREKYPQAEVHNEICMATQTRQQAVAEQARHADLCIVVGDPRSNNSNRLAQVSQEIAQTAAHRVADVTEIQLDWLKSVQTVAVTAGASTPTAITNEVVKYLEQFDVRDKTTWDPKRTVDPERLLPTVRRS
jgi:4-hydroxy-3-methylbut-2-enyl diphosphate reductase